MARAKTTRGACCPSAVTAANLERRGASWVVGAFLICPCHLPLTLGLAATLLSGTAAGALLRAHPYVAGLVVSVTWLAATARGFRLLQNAQAFADATAGRTQERNGS
jgi:hypothetical protein